MYDYLPINLSSLSTDTTVGCDLYLLVETKSESRYVLYCRGEAVFDNNKSENLLEKNISRLFIKKDDQQKYYKYIESDFQNIISDTRISSMKRQRSCITLLQTWLKISSMIRELAMSKERRRLLTTW